MSNEIPSISAHARARVGQFSVAKRPGWGNECRPALRPGWPRGAPRLAGVSLSIGIVGLPNVGKSTLFNALTRASAVASNYPFATIEPNVGIVGIPDPRLAALAGLYDSARIVPATVRFVDIAGLVRGASQGQGLGNQFLAHIRETDAICQVVRVFSDPDVSHVDGDVSPARDVDTVATELILADLQTLEKAVPRLVKEAKFAKNPERQRIADPAAAAQQIRDRDLQANLAAMAAPAEVVFLDVKTEAELADLPEDEVAEMAAELGMGEPGLNRLTRPGGPAQGPITVP